MFGAIGRWFKAIGYLLTGKTDKASQALMKNPHAHRAAWDEQVDEHAASIREHKEAVGNLLALVESKRRKLEVLTEDIKKLGSLRNGALAKAKQLAQGKTKEELEHNEEYLKCKSAYADFSSTLQEKQERAAELEADITRAEENIRKHKVGLQGRLRGLDKLKEEREESVAAVITAEEERKAAEMVAGISNRGSDATLANLRAVRDQATANARISSELAGLDTRTQEADFLAYANASQADSEFEQLLGLADQADKQAAAQSAEKPAAEAQLPE